MSVLGLYCRSDVLLTLASVYYHSGREQQCDELLEQALATDFTVREMPLYHLLRARRASQQGTLFGECL